MRMHAVIVGGGASGVAIQRACEAEGIRARQVSRSTGFDVTADSLPPLEADVVIEATNVVATGRKPCVEFFERSARSVAHAAAQAGARHILLSIVNTDRPEVQGYGYFAGKKAQEETAGRFSPALTIVRTTQWFEFGAQVLQRNRLGPLGFVPGMRIKPIALDAAARVLAETASGKRTGGIVEASGPEEMTLWELVQRTPKPGGVLPVPVFLPTGFGRAFRRGALLPDPGVEEVGPRLEDWSNRAVPS